MLYLVGTPIGNMEDITLRALETLRGVDVVASEDTRKTGLLLKRYDIKKPLISFHEHNEEQAVRRVLGLAAEGKSVALVTDAGMPGISDPGYTLVRAALDAGVPISAIPGPTAFVPALVLSGLPVHAFTAWSDRSAPPPRGRRRPAARPPGTPGAGRDSRRRSACAASPPPRGGSAAAHPLCAAE